MKETTTRIMFYISGDRLTSPIIADNKELLPAPTDPQMPNSFPGSMVREMFLNGSKSSTFASLDKNTLCSEGSQRLFTPLEVSFPRAESAMDEN